MEDPMGEWKNTVATDLDNWKNKVKAEITADVLIAVGGAITSAGQAVQQQTEKSS